MTFSEFQYFIVTPNSVCPNKNAFYNQLVLCFVYPDAITEIDQYIVNFRYPAKLLESMSNNPSECKSCSRNHGN